ncbi:hypothetical protein [Embleya scabrispora]|uniref:hypothetical protein n=1 Tax=Embleya scabrispora TaxID=159449 RepID=UPI0013750A3B|nr:hypothetical protein [Embleya scabrispora]
MRWGIDLAGLLTHLSRTPEVQAPPLPLTICGEPEQGNTWHWAATTAWPRDLPHDDEPTEIHYWSSTTDHRRLECLANALPTAMPSNKGVYRDRLYPIVVTRCRRLVWHAVAEPEALRNLLEPVAAVGKKRSIGEGVVTHWTVQPSTADRWEAGHLHPHGPLGRPVPPRCLRGRGHVEHGGLAAGPLHPGHPAAREIFEVFLPIALPA